MHRIKLTNMIISKPKIILNPYDWLPSYGETEIAIRFKGSELAVDVFYDSNIETIKTPIKKTILFTRACSFNFTSTPGVKLTNFEYQDAKLQKGTLGSLIEYESSEAAQKWQEHFHRSKAAIRHFEMWFLSANQSLTVFAEGCELVDK